MTESEFLEMVESLVVWKSDGTEAIHKPLMLLFGLAYFEFTQKQLMSFAEVQLSMKSLLKKFGPVRKAYHPEYPFWRLNNSGFWKVVNAEGVLPDNRSSDPSARALIENDVQAGFSDAAYKLLAVSPDLVMRIKECLFDRLNLSDEDRRRWIGSIAREVEVLAGI